MNKTNLNKQVVFMILMISCFSTSSSFAAPQVTIISVINSAVNIVGTNFGTKTNAAPVFFNTMEAVPTGTMPVGFIVKNGLGTPVSDSPARGTSVKSMKFFADLTATDATNKEAWNRSVYDLGVGGADRIYISYWLYLDKTGTSCTSSPSNQCQWQWKNTYIGGNPTAYTSNIANDTTMGIDNWFKNSTNSWFNTFALKYYNNLVSGGGSNPSMPSDGYLFNQWQRVDVYVQRSSLPSIADGKYIIQRIGKPPMINDANIITNDSDDLPWRYIAMGQALTNVNQNYVGNGGRVVWSAFFDDVYIDTTQARVEICDSPTWSARTQCEIQPATAWADSQITFNVNKAGFADGQVAYIYVVDSTGAVNSSGYIYKIGAPLPPANFIKVP